MKRGTSSASWACFDAWCWLPAAALLVVCALAAPTGGSAEAPLRNPFQSHEREQAQGLPQNLVTLVKADDATGPVVRLNAQQAQVSRLLQAMADLRHENVLISDRVQGSISLTLEKMDWQQAWELVLKAAGLREQRLANVRWILTLEEFALQQRQQLMEIEAERQLVPITHQVYRLHYATAGDLEALIESPASRLLSDRGSVFVDQRINALVVADIASHLQQVSLIIDQLDIPLKQVSISARLVRASDSIHAAFGIRWGLSSGASSPVAPNTSEEANAGPVADEERPGRLSSWRAELSAPANFSQAGQLTLGLVRRGLGIDAELSALVDQGQARVLARPQILTTDQAPAVIESGVEIPYQETSRSGATSTSFKDAVLRLHVTPQVTPDNGIILRLNIRQDAVGQIFNGIPSINTNAMETTVFVANGDTLVLGGILQQDDSNARTRVPLLGTLPVLGRLFRGERKRADQQQLLVFITPTVLKLAR